MSVRHDVCRLTNVRSGIRTRIHLYAKSYWPSSFLLNVQQKKLRNTTEWFAIAWTPPFHLFFNAFQRIGVIKLIKHTIIFSTQITHHVLHTPSALYSSNHTFIKQKRISKLTLSVTCGVPFSPTTCPSSQRKTWNMARTSYCTRVVSYRSCPAISNIF